MSTPIVTIDVAHTLHSQGRPFTVFLRFRGANWNNASGRSDKWWSLTYKGSGPVLGNHGRAGSKGRKVPFEYGWTTAEQKCRDKLHDGYTYSPNTVRHVPPASTAPAVPKVNLEGVFAEIRKIIEVGDDHFKCFDAHGAFLLDLTESGAEQVANADTFRITVTRLAS